MLLEQLPCLCQSQLDPPWHFPGTSDLRVKHGNSAGSPATHVMAHEILFLAISGLLWASPAGDTVPPLLQSALATEHAGRAGIYCRNDLRGPGAAQCSGRTCSCPGCSLSGQPPEAKDAKMLLRATKGQPLCSPSGSTDRLHPGSLVILEPELSTEPKQGSSLHLCTGSGVCFLSTL